MSYRLKRLEALEAAELKRDHARYERAYAVAVTGLTYEQRAHFEAFCIANAAQSWDDGVCMVPPDDPGVPYARPAWCSAEWEHVVDLFSLAFWPVYHALGGTRDALPFPGYAQVPA